MHKLLHFLWEKKKESVVGPSTPPLGLMTLGSSPTLPNDWVPPPGLKPSQGPPSPIPPAVPADTRLRRRVPAGTHVISRLGSPSSAPIGGITPPQDPHLPLPNKTPTNLGSPRDLPPEKASPSKSPVSDSANEDDHDDEVTYAAEEVWVLLAALLSDKPRYKALLGSKDTQAHNLLNLMQKVVDYENTPKDLKRSIVIAMMRLCSASGVYPQCLTLQHKVDYEPVAVAAGGFGEVFKGSIVGNTHVSLKVVKLYQNSQIERLLKNLAKEGILWSHLRHPNLLPFYGIYRLSDRHERVCLVSPWMENGNVTHYLKANPEVPRLFLIYEVLAGLEYLHENQVVHGDLKGANILVSSEGVACLADFGLSSIVDKEVLNWTSIETEARKGGTLRWQAPELIEGSENGEVPRNTFSSDVYAIASVMYEILTGRIPYYELTNDGAVIYKVIKKITPTRPSPDLEAELELTDEIWDIMEECWNENPNERPTVIDVAKKLQSIRVAPKLTTERLLGPKQLAVPGNDASLLTPQTFRRIIRSPQIRFSLTEVDSLKEY